MMRWVALASFGCVLLRTAWLSDDAFITFRVIDNFVNGYGLRWNVAERVQAYTHPAWMLLLTVPYSLTREIFYTSLIVSLGLSVAAAGVVAFRLAASPAAGLLGVAILLSSRAFVDFSTSGLENPLTHLLLALFALQIARPITSTRDVLVRASLAGLGMLNRLDTALVFLPALLWGLRHERRPARLLALAAGFLPLLAWLAFATVYYGYPFPNTALAKLGTGIRTSELLGQGLHYLQNSWRSDPITLATIGAAFAAAALKRSATGILLAPGILLYVVYVVWIGGDFMSGRFLTLPLLCSVIVLVSAGWPRRSVVAAVAAVAVGFFAPYPTLLSGTDYGLQRADVIDDHGIADERGYYFWMSGWMNGRDGPKPTNVEMSRIRAWRRCGFPIAAEGAIGFAGFVAGPGVHIVDYHGLADPLLSRLPMVERDPLYAEFYQLNTGKTGGDRFRVGHYLRAIPPGYLAHLLGRDDAFTDPGLAQFVGKLERVTRGRLFDPSRLREIVRLNLGRYDPLIQSSSARLYSPPRWQEVIAARPESAAGYANAAEDLLKERRDVPAADRMLRSALQRCPEDASSTVNLAVVLWLEGRDREAMTTSQRALALDPRLERAYSGLGVLYTKLGQLDRALEAFSTAIELDPTLIRAYYGMARTYVRAGRYEEARDALERLLAILPHDARALASLGNVLARLGDENEAIAAWSKAAQLGSSEARDALRTARDRGIPREEWRDDARQSFTAGDLTPP